MGSPFIPAPRRRRHRQSSPPGMDPDSNSDGEMSLPSASSQDINPFGPRQRRGGFGPRNIFGRPSPPPFPGGGGRGRFPSRIPVPIGRGRGGGGFGAPRRHRSNTPSPPPFPPWYEGNRRPGGTGNVFQRLQRLLQEQGPADDPMGYGNPGPSLPFGSAGAHPYGRFDSGPFPGQEASPFYGGDNGSNFGGGPGFLQHPRRRGMRRRINRGFPDPAWGAGSSDDSIGGGSDGGFSGDSQMPAWARFGFGGSSSPPPPRRRRRRRQAEPFDFRSRGF